MRLLSVRADAEMTVPCLCSSWHPANLLRPKISLKKPMRCRTLCHSAYQPACAEAHASGRVRPPLSFDARSRPLHLRVGRTCCHGPKDKCKAPECAQQGEKVVCENRLGAGSGDVLQADGLNPSVPVVHGHPR